MPYCSHCNNEYQVNANETDDGFCSFECWESANCGEPEVPEEAFIIEED